MCQCDPTIKTPFCGKPGCEWPTVAKPQEPKRDYSLLRPFDLEAAKAGELLIDSDYDAVRFVGSATKSDEVCVEINSISLLVGRPEDLFMAPLAWVEGRPVYKGDKPWNTCDGRQYTVTSFCKSTECLLTAEIRADGARSVPVEDLTWQKPKVKKSGWRVVDKGTLNYSKKLAEETAASITNSVAVYGEWEE